MDAPPLLAATIAQFLASPEELGQALQSSAAFSKFHQLAANNSGLDMRHLDPASARYRIADPANGVRENLSWESTIVAGGQLMSLRELLTPQRALDRDQLIYALWRLTSFAQVKDFVCALQLMVRYGHDTQGQLQAQVLLAQSLIPMIEIVERRDYLLASGDMASDAITRNLGLRAKIFSLDRAVRKEVNGDRMFDRLSRTLSRLNK